MKKTGVIYIATDTARDNLQYVGQTIRTLKRRKKGSYNSYFQNAINDHGDKIEWEIVGEFPIEELDLMERCYIWGLSTIYPLGYNFESGGNENKIVSEETKKKMSEANTGKKHSAETKKKMSEAQSGEENGFYGKHHSAETKQKLSEANTGKKHTEEAKRKIGEASKNREVSVETRKRMSEAQSGEKNHNYGKHLSEKHKQKLSEARRGEKHHNAKLTWEIVKEIREEYKIKKCSHRELAEKYGISRPQIGAIINNKNWIIKE